MGTEQAMATYQPKIVMTDLGPEQRFDANILVIETVAGGTIVALGDLVTQDGVPLNQGTPMNSLILQLFDDDLTVEFNDQGNQRSGDAVERFELSPAFLRVVFGAGDGPCSGRVSLSPEIEIFDADCDDEPVLLRSVRVGLSRVTAQVAGLQSALRSNASAATRLVEVEQDQT